MERIIVVPLRKARRGPRTKFTQKAIKFVRSFVCRHMKVEEVKIGSELNEMIWEKGRKNPPRRVEIRVYKQDNVAFVEISSIKETSWNAFIGKQEKEDKKTKKQKKTEKETKKKKSVKKKVTKKKTKKKPVKKKKSTKKPVKKKETKKAPAKKKPTKKKETKKPAKTTVKKTKSAKPKKPAKPKKKEAKKK
ncbi:MAG: 50S ribosomal protein L31e [Candidatus Altiarchaeota archaeon]|nr:50S ribosomal protein L31e [Candidatus Altiarchaeota archaeon]